MQVPTPPGQALDAHPGNVSSHNQTCLVCTACLICCACACNNTVNREKATSERVCSSPDRIFATDVVFYTVFAHMLSIFACIETVKLHHREKLQASLKS